MPDLVVEQFEYLYFTVKPWRSYEHAQRASFYQRAIPLLSSEAKSPPMRESEAGAFMIEFDVINDMISREIAFDTNGKPISCMVLDGADDQNGNDVDKYDPTQITRAAFEAEWKKLNQ